MTRAGDFQRTGAVAGDLHQGAGAVATDLQEYSCVQEAGVFAGDLQVAGAAASDIKVTLTERN